MARKLSRSVVLPSSVLTIVARKAPMSEALRRLHRREDAWALAAQFWHWRGGIALEIRSARAQREAS